MRFDDGALESYRALGGDAAVARVYRLFLTCAPARIEGIRNGLEAGRATEVENWMHSLLSSSLSVGATELATLARQGEEAASRADLAVARSLFDRIQEGFRGVEAHLLRRLEALPDADLPPHPARGPRVAEPPRFG